MAEENVFEYFSKMDVSKHVQKKMGLSYLSWSWAWAIVKQYDFEATREYTQFDELVDGQLTGRKVDYCKTDTGTYVECTVTIKGHSETESLYVMDYKNKAVLKPDQAQINKAKQRCFVKACALFGLGLNIYAGEDLPVAEDNSQSHSQLHKSNARQAPKAKNQATGQKKLTNMYLQHAIEKLGKESAMKLFNQAKMSCGASDLNKLSDNELTSFNNIYIGLVKDELNELAKENE